MKEIKRVIERASHILITAGAGMSADSGLPTFRDKEGLWEAYPPLKEFNFGFADIASPQAFFNHPDLAWAFYGHRYNLYSQTKPHEGYKMLLDLCGSKKSYFVLTSNVDEHFIKAGFNSKKVYEIHGNINYLQCSCSTELWRLQREIPMNGCYPIEFPRCPFCGQIARPNILMFADYGFNDERENLQSLNFMRWKQSIDDEPLVILEIGAGTKIPTIRNMGEKLVKTHPDALLIRINPNESYINPSLGYSIELGGLEGIKKLLQ